MSTTTDRTQWTQKIDFRLYGSNLELTVSQILDMVDDMHDSQSDTRQRLLDAIRPYVSTRQLESPRFTKRVEATWTP